jgi:antimicrobial peptide system SdpA family protein
MTPPSFRPIETRIAVSDPKDLQALGGLLASMVAAWAVLGAYALHASMPFNAIELPREHKAALVEVLPEGWRFFTRNPQEEQLQPLVLRGGAWTSASIQPASSARNLFGIDRAGRAQSVELALLLETVPGSSWADCTDTPVSCLPPPEAAVPIVNHSAGRTLCGEIAIVAQRPVPWAWAASTSPDLQMPARVVRLEVQC